MDYKEDLRIDPDGLDVEWLKQPGLFMQYAEVSARAKNELETAKQNMDVILAEMRLDIASNPEKFGLMKVTENAIAAVIEIRTEYKEAVARVTQAKLNVDLTTAAVRAMEMRKDALQDLVRLAIAGYFATPNVPRDLSTEAAKAGLHQEAVNKIKSVRRGV